MAEYLLEIVYHVVVGCRSVAHHEIYRLQSGDFRNGGFIHVLVETGYQIVPVHKMHVLSCHLPRLNLCREFNAEVEHHLEQQIFAAAVGLHILIEQGLLVKLLRSVIDIFHIAAVEFQHAETGVELINAFLVGILFLDFFSGTADAFFAYLTDILISGFIGLALLIGQFGKLHHDEFAIAATLGIEFHYGVGGGCATAEEVKDNGIFISTCLKNEFNNINIFRKVEKVLCCNIAF